MLTVPLKNELSVLQVRDAINGDWQLPRTFVHEGERLTDAVVQSLQAKAGATGLAPQQLQMFDVPARDSRGWVISVGHLDVVSFSSPSSGLGESRVPVVQVVAATAMVHGHDDIVAVAVARLRASYEMAPDPWGLVAEPFTMTELRRVHDAVAGRSLLPDSFRRAMVPRLEAPEEKRAETPGKPAGV